jgi:hypothetical protein
MVAPAVGPERGGGEQGMGPGERRDMAGTGGRLSVVLSYLEVEEWSEIEHLRRLVHCNCVVLQNAQVGYQQLAFSSFSVSRLSN